jgi:hypothetical protein
MTPSTYQESTLLVHVPRAFDTGVDVLPALELRSDSQYATHEQRTQDSQRERKRKQPEDFSISHFSGARRLRENLFIVDGSGDILSWKVRCWELRA